MTALSTHAPAFMPQVAARSGQAGRIQRSAMWSGLTTHSSERQDQAAAAAAAAAAPVCEALSQLAVGVVRRNSLVRHGAVPAALGVLQAYSEDPITCEASCRALSNLFLGSNGAGRDSTSPAIDALLTALRRHSRDANCVSAACSALANLATSSGGAVLVANAGGCEAVSAALRYHGLVNAHAAGAILQCLANLVGDEEGEEAGILMGVHDLLEVCRRGLLSIHAFSSDAAVTLSGFRLLRNAAGSRSIIRTRLAQLGVMGALCGALQRFNGASEEQVAVREAAFQTVANLLPPDQPDGGASGLFAADALVAGLLDKSCLDARMAAAGRARAGMDGLALAASASMARIVLACAPESRLNAILRTRLGRYASACGAEAALSRGLRHLPPMLEEEALRAIRELRALAA